MGMVERVARAMWNQRRLGDGDECADFDGSRLKGTSWRDFEGLARDAIEAMREPTEAQVVTAMITPYPTVAEAGGVLPQAREAVRLEWQAMIDAALRD